jgi:hypothetical protein
MSGGSGLGCRGRFLLSRKQVLPCGQDAGRRQHHSSDDPPIAIRRPHCTTLLCPGNLFRVHFKATHAKTGFRLGAICDPKRLGMLGESG